MKKTLLLLALFLCIVLGAFAAYVSNPPAADIGTLPDFDEPATSSAFVPSAQVPSSWLSIPIELSVEDMQDLANRKLMRQYNGSTEVLDGTVKGKLNYRVDRVGDVKISGSSDGLNIAFPVKFNVKFNGNVLAAVVRVPFSAQTDGELKINISVKPSIRRDWSIKTDAKVDFEWVKSPYLNIAGIKIGIQNEASNFFKEAVRDNLPKLEGELNKVIDLREIMQREWDNLSIPFKIAENFWLAADPRSISALPLEISPDKVVLRSSIEAGLSASMNEIPQSRKKKLPHLGSSLSASEDITIAAKALLAFNALLKEADTSEIDLGAAKIDIRSIKIKGDGERILGAVELGMGSLSGRIYVTGSPVYDDKTRTLSVSDFDLEPSTRNELIQSAAWLIRPILLDSIREKLSWNVGNDIDRLLKSARDAVLKRELTPELELNGEINEAKFDNLRVVEQGIEITLFLTGKAGLIYKPR